VRASSILSSVGSPGAPLAKFMTLTTMGAMLRRASPVAPGRLQAPECFEGRAKIVAQEQARRDGVALTSKARTSG